MAKEQNPVGWFEIPASDLKRAKKFYEKIFGYKLSLQKMGKVDMAFFPMIPGAPCAAGALVMCEDYFTPSHDGTLVYFSVEAIDAALKKIEKAGGKTVMPKMSIGEHGFIALIIDTEGNQIGLHAMS